MTQRLTPDTLLSNLAWRYATKKFDIDKKIPAEIWNTLEEALILSPSSFGLQPWKFLVVNDKDVREKLKPVSWNQSQITDSSHLVVFARKLTIVPGDVEKLISKIAEVRKMPVENLAQYKGMMFGFIANPGFDAQAWTAKQAYIALGNFLTSAALLGIDACPMEGFDSEAYDRILGLDGSGYSATVVATAGYRAEDDGYASLPKVRYGKNELVRHI